MKYQADTIALQTNSTSGYILPQKEMSVVIYHSIHDVSDDWERAAPSHNIFLQKKLPSSIRRKST